MADIIERSKRGAFTLVAEIGVNYYDIAEKLHISPMEAAKYMVLAAKNAGIHGVKFQTYKADALASRHSPAYWDRREEATASQYELFRKFDRFGEGEYRELSAFCRRIGIAFFSTPFDFPSVQYLAPLMDVYKISSSDITNLPFIEYIAKQKKPILLSTGASDEAEIRAAVERIRRYHTGDLALLHCVLEYPTPYDHANLAKISALRAAFPEAIIGYSDHTKPDDSGDVIKTAYLLGAVLIEKHFTVDKTWPGNDHYHAMDPHDAARILAAIDRIEKLKGSADLSPLPTEQAARENARRSIVAARDIPAGSVITAECLAFKRPGTGISPKDVARVTGRKAKQSIEQDMLLQEDMLE